MGTKRESTFLKISNIKKACQSAGHTVGGKPASHRQSGNMRKTYWYDFITLCAVILTEPTLQPDDPTAKAKGSDVHATLEGLERVLECAFYAKDDVMPAIISDNHLWSNFSLNTSFYIMPFGIQILYMFLKSSY
jgi:hypothetical protein